jgi:molybdate transport system substrate-binding protein
MRWLMMAALLLGSAGARAAEVQVMISGGFTAAFQVLAPGFERESGHRLVMVQGGSMGTAPTAIPMRLQRGEPADVVIMVGEALDGLAAQGRVVPGSRVDLANSGIGLAVRVGVAKPDISTVEGLRQVLLAAHGVGYSASASGRYVNGPLFERLGIAAQMQGKARLVTGEPVATAVARGELDIAFQQVAELLPVRGVQYVGPLPEAVQLYTVFAGGVASTARQPGAAPALLRYLAGPAARAAVLESGLLPLPGR